MLLLDSALEIANAEGAEGLTVYRDSADPATFHYLPGPPRPVAEGGRAGLELVRFRGAVPGEGGGLLFVDVELTHTEERLAAARATLAERFGLTPHLVPVLFRAGTVRLAAFDVGPPLSASPPGPPGDAPAPASPAAGTAGPAGTGPDPTPAAGPVAAPSAAPPAPAAGRLVERVLGSATPSLLGRQRAIFSLRLSREGAVLAEAALTGAAAPLVVAYDLEFSGLAPARGVHAEVDHRRAYDVLHARAAADSLWFRADLQHAAEALVQSGAVRIVDVDFQGSDPAELERRQREIRETLAELTELLFFRPAASPAAIPPAALAAAPGVSAAWQAAGAARAAFALYDLAQVETRTLTYDLSVARAVRRRVAPQGALALSPEAAASGAWRRDVDLGAEWLPVEVAALADPEAGWEGVSAVEVDLRAGAERRTLVLTKTAPRARAVLLPGLEPEGRLRALAAPAPDDLGAPPEPGEFAPLPARHLVLDPEALAGRRRLRVVLAAPTGGPVERFEGRLGDGTRSRDLLLTPERPEVEAIVWGDAVLRLAGNLVLAGGAVEPVDRELAPGEDAVLLLPPPALTTEVYLALADPLERHARAFVELEDTARGERKTFELTPAQPSARWSRLRPAGAPAPALRARIETVGRDARVVAGGWHPVAGSVVLAGDPDLAVDPVEVVLLPLPGLEAAQVALTSLTAPEGAPALAEAFLDPSAPTATLRLPRRTGEALRYRLEGTLFYADRVDALGPREERAEVLVVGMG